MQSILIVDDMESIHEMLDTVVQPLGYATLYASNGDDAIQLYKKERPEIVLCDIKMSPKSGLEIAQELQSIDPKVIVIMMSGHATVENALDAMKLGVFDFLTKPFKVDQLMAALNRASKQLAETANENSNGSDCNVLLGNSPSLKTLKDTIARAAESTTPALIQGEAGTHKSVIASQIHASSADRPSDSPFVSFDCQDSDSGALKGALKDDGLFKEAAGGTLYFSNIDALPSDFQETLSELIRDAKTETRVVCSTAIDLEQKVGGKEFSESLYYRISSLTVQVPSLRERPDDIAAIAHSILEANELGDYQLTEKANSLVQAYRWPGNLDELKDAIEDAAAHCSDNRIDEQDLPERIRDLSSWTKLADFIEEATHEYKRRVLQACQGDANQAAEILGCEADSI